MATITDYGSIEDKIKSFMLSKEYQEKISKNRKGVALGNIEAFMKEAGEVFRDCLVRAMSDADVTSTIISIVADSSSFVMDPPVIISMSYNTAGGGKATGYITYSFVPEEIYRPSLERGFKTSDGIDNIVSLFDTGYDTVQVRGRWVGHGKKQILSTPFRDELAFVQEAVDNFNNRFGGKYQCKAKIVADEKYYARQILF